MDKGTLVVGGLAVVVVLSQAPSLMAQFEMDKISKAAGMASRQESQNLQVQQEAIDGQAEIAETRYQEGCEIVFATGTKKAASLQEGEPVIAGAYAHLYKAGVNTKSVNPSHFIPKGITLCGPYGDTGITEFDPERGYAVVRQMATTPNKEVVKAAMSRYAGAERPSIVRK